jgi:hypothetical protein
MKILLLDQDEGRRESRSKQLANAGYDVTARKAHEYPGNPGTFDLMVCVFHENPEDVPTYVDTLRVSNPQQPILLLTDYGVFVPQGCLEDTPHCAPLVKEIARVLTGNSDVRELGKEPQQSNPVA